MAETPVAEAPLAGSRLADPFLADRAEEDAALAVEVVRASLGPRWQWPSVLVVGGMVASLAIVASDHFRRGAVLFAAFVLLAFFLRLILRDEDAGWLAVRSRGVDLACLGVLATSLSIFALIVPPPS
ncbi:MAG TPA: DUF3017 domain-containing protein [Candidatus Nanopelagicales bacterium]